MTSSAAGGLVPLNYMIPEAGPGRRRPSILTDIGVLSIVYGLLSGLGNLLMMVMDFTGPWGPGDGPRPVDLNLLYEIETGLSLLAAFWLFVAGIWVFADGPNRSPRPRQMLRAYVVVKLVLVGCLVALTIGNDFDIVGRVASLDWIEHGLFFLLLTAPYPVFLLWALRSKSIAAYYRGASVIEP